MATTVLLLADEGADVSVRADALARLAELGVTSLAVLREADAVAVVLEGWAFDPARSATSAARAFAGAGAAVRTFHPLMEMAVTTAPSKGGRDAAELDGAPAPGARLLDRDDRPR